MELFIHTDHLNLNPIKFMLVQIVFIILLIKSMVLSTGILAYSNNTLSVQ